MEQVLQLVFRNLVFTDVLLLKIMMVHGSEVDGKAGASSGGATDPNTKENGAKARLFVPPV
jgi:hypothetical protein